MNVSDFKPDITWAESGENAYRDSTAVVNKLYTTELSVNQYRLAVMYSNLCIRHYCTQRVINPALYRPLFEFNTYWLRPTEPLSTVFNSIVPIVIIISAQTLISHKCYEIRELENQCWPVFPLKKVPSQRFSTVFSHAMTVTRRRKWRRS